VRCQNYPPRQVFDLSTSKWGHGSSVSWTSFLPVFSFLYDLPFSTYSRAFFNGVDFVSYRCTAPHNTIKLLLTGPYYNFWRYFNKYRSFSKFAEFSEVGKIAASPGHSNAKKLSASGGFAP